MFRQGDILILPVTEELVGIKRYRRRQKDLGHVIAEGEATGHHHRIKTPRISLFTVGRKLFLRVPKGRVAELLHEEHGTLKIPAGVHEVRRQREYVPPTPTAPARTARVFD